MLLQLQLLIGTRCGVRVEYVTAALLPGACTRSSASSSSALMMAVLQPANAFACEAAGVRVVAWGAPACRVSEVSAARFRLPAPAAEREYDADGGAAAAAASTLPQQQPPQRQKRRRRRSGALSLISPSASSFSFVDTAAPFFKKKKKRRQRRSATVAGRVRIIKDEEAEAEDGTDDADDSSSSDAEPQPPPRDHPPMRGMSGGGAHTNHNNTNKRWLELELTDFEAADVGYVWVIVHAQRAAGAPTTSADTTAARALPHAAHAFRIENTCGACRTPFALDLSAFRCLRASRGTTGDLITMLSGTFAPCANRIQVDFRGVRSIAAMRQDWELISSVRARDETSVSIYMLVMKACLGIPALIVDHGATPPGLEGVGAAIAAEGRRKCYLAERAAAYCTNYAQHIDVCQAVELVGIKWAALPGGEDAVAAPLRLDGVRSSVHVSRRGGVMLRLIFPRGTAWDEASEAAVVRDCNRLLVVLRRALMGQAM